MSNKINVVIGGEIVTLRSTEQEEYIQRVARYADQKIEEIKSKSKAAALDDRARGILVALNIADDYQKEADKLSRLDSLHKQLVAEMGKMQKENAQMSDEIKQLKTRLASTQKELDEFIKSFDTKDTPEGENILTLPQKPRKKAR